MICNERKMNEKIFLYSENRCYVKADNSDRILFFIYMESFVDST